MFETETNLLVRPSSQIPKCILREFQISTRNLQSRSELLWGEHCTECAAPACYSTCEFFAPRPDLQCRRFQDGIVRIPVKGICVPHILEVTFKHWGKLLGFGTGAQHSFWRCRIREYVDVLFGQLLQRFPMRFGSRVWYLRRRNGAKKTAAMQKMPWKVLPTKFVMQCYNPGNLSLQFLFCISRADNTGTRFHEKITVDPGFNCIEFPVGRIAEIVDIREPITVALFPEEHVVGHRLYFGLMEFVSTSTAPKNKPAQCKCVVWDLDNTVWNGTLVEHGADGVQLNEDAVDLIRRLDSRGVLNSIASKNDPEPARRLLADRGLLELFVFPQISWEPKSDSIARLAKSLNISRDTLVFVDDTRFEREEVSQRFPEVRTVDARDMKTLLELPEIQGPMTKESAHRRRLYHEQEMRQVEEQGFAGDYRSFLLNCELVLTIQCLSEESLDRAHELSQRTNQLNFSGVRYERSVLAKLLTNKERHTFVLDCKDKFGDYGTVGFAIVDSMQPRLTDMMFSCRVMGRRVEHAFLRYLISRYRAINAGVFRATYTRTDRNAQSGKVFDDMGFRAISVKDGVADLEYRGEVPDDEQVITIVDHSQ